MWNALTILRNNYSSISLPNTWSHGSSLVHQLHTSMAFHLLFILVSALLLANGMGVCGTQESPTTDSQLRKEIKSQLNETLAEALPEVCNFGCHGVQCNDDTITDRLAPLLSQLTQLLTPGLTCSHPATSCMEILQLAPQSPSGFYWIRANEHDARYMYCDMEKSCKGVTGG